MKELNAYLKSHQMTDVFTAAWKITSIEGKPLYPAEQKKTEKPSTNWVESRHYWAARSHMQCALTMKTNSQTIQLNTRKHSIEQWPVALCPSLCVTYSPCRRPCGSCPRGRRRAADWCRSWCRPWCGPLSAVWHWTCYSSHRGPRPSAVRWAAKQWNGLKLERALSKVFRAHLHRQPERGEGNDDDHHQAGDSLASTLRLLGHAHAGALVPEAHDHAHVQPADDHQGQQVGADEEAHLEGALLEDFIINEATHGIRDIRLVIIVDLYGAKVVSIKLKY